MAKRYHSSVTRTTADCPASSSSNVVGSVFVWPGKIRSGRISASGARTNRRVCKRGCGKCNRRRQSCSRSDKEDRDRSCAKHCGGVRDRARAISRFHEARPKIPGLAGIIQFHHCVEKILRARFATDWIGLVDGENRNGSDTPGRPMIFARAKRKCSRRSPRLEPRATAALIGHFKPEHLPCCKAEPVFPRSRPRRAAHRAQKSRDFPRDVSIQSFVRTDKNHGVLAHDFTFANRFNWNFCPSSRSLRRICAIVFAVPLGASFFIW